jgi:predicted DNA-binding transcriptional regulator AlpA
MSQQLARVPKVAEILDVKKGRVYELVRENFFPPGVVIKLGKRQLRFNEDALREFIARGGCLVLQSISQNDDSAPTLGCGG